MSGSSVGHGGVSVFAVTGPISESSPTGTSLFDLELDELFLARDKVTRRFKRSCSWSTIRQSVTLEFCVFRHDVGQW